MNFKNSIIAFSGGKDSVAVSKFMLNQGYKIPHVCVINKELDYPCHLNYIKDEEISPIYKSERGLIRGTHTINIANTYIDKDVNVSLEFIKSIDLKMYQNAIELLKYKN